MGWPWRIYIVWGFGVLGLRLVWVCKAPPAGMRRPNIVDIGLEMWVCRDFTMQGLVLTAYDAGTRQVPSLSLGPSVSVPRRVTQERNARFLSLLKHSQFRLPYRIDVISYGVAVIHWIAGIGVSQIGHVLLNPAL